MHRFRRSLLIGFGVFWLIGFVLVAPAPLFRFLWIQSNNRSIESPVQLFEGMDWTHPYKYQSIGRAYRTLAQQTDSDVIIMYFDAESPLNTDAYMRYFNEYQIIWAYPKRVVIASSLDDIPLDATVIISTTNPAILSDCLSGQEHLYLCRS